ncbi:hypothetical protein [Tumebacillus flagellatus]|uniref:Uncharacterized protein n=1 Tax=Tumebacillus flagellatus TaxID=1157490 RepID=A0A074LQZ0_9BACL|nr:hypothetical protein [Tumebacillus flagellatus]KEO82910.1 hypothetical protein EL26_12495 [Tumebacillus flagellatus]
MFKVQLYNDAFHHMMQHDKSMDGFYPKNSAIVEKEMSSEEFDNFCKKHNLVPYKTHLRNYHHNYIAGDFSEI